MKKLLLIAAGAGMLWALPVVTSPADAQTSVTVNPGGVTVRERERGPRWRHRDRCRTVIERVRRPNGTVITKRTRVCRD
ncbi:MAG: hypothetical protein JO245_00505 [Pseudolabrys sp.]|nr:hypothetical protein [Pseudolabrys sp.]